MNIKLEPGVLDTDLPTRRNPDHGFTKKIVQYCLIDSIKHPDPNNYSAQVRDDTENSYRKR